MRKSTKLAILVAALVALCTMAAFAADTWKQEGEDWYCLDKDGQVQIGVWKKSGNNYYYLDDATGVMVKNKLVETDGYKYWCGADGARVIDQWVKVPVENDDDGWEWMYFKSVSGKAAVGDGSGFITVKGKKYLFTSEGYMLYGYLLDKVGGKAENAVDATYFMGTKDEGAQFTGWKKFVDGELGGAYSDTALVYFYFKNGEKITSKYATLNDKGQLKIDGKYYTFKDDGAMVKGVYPTMSDYYYYGASDDGSYKKKVWVKTTDILGGDDAYWFYFNGDGVVEKAATAGQIKKINSKYYLLSNQGKLLSGLALIQNAHPDDPVDAAAVLVNNSWKKWSDVTGIDLSDTKYANCHFYYFNTDTDTDGTMKTGSVTVKVDDDEKTLVFDKHGVAYEGVVSKKIYNNGILQAAGDAKYAVKALNTATEDYKKGSYLVNASGTIMNNTRVCDGDGIYWVVLDYKIARVLDKEYASQAATALKNKKSGFKVGSNTYKLEIDQDKTVDAKGKYVVYTYVKDNSHVIAEFDWTK